MKTLRHLFLNELTEVYDAEHRVGRALPKLAQAANHPVLQATLRSQRQENKGHLIRLEAVFAEFGENAADPNSETTLNLLVEAEEIADRFKGSPALNAALICALQKVEHHQTATYDSLLGWARRLNQPKAEGLLREIIDEKDAANGAFTELARVSINPAALIDPGLWGGPYQRTSLYSPPHPSRELHLQT